VRATLSPANVSLLSTVAQVRTGWVTTVRWSPDGQTIAVATGQQVNLYVRSFGAQPTFRLTGFDAPVKNIAFSRYGKMIATASTDGWLRLWDIRAAPTRSHAFHVGDALTCVCFSGDERRVVAGTGEGEVRVWEIATGAVTVMPDRHAAEVTTVIWDSGWIYSTGRDGKLLRHNVYETEPARIVASYTDALRDLALNTRGRAVHAVSRDGRLNTWSSEGNLRSRVLAHDGGADCAALTANGTLLATGGRDNLVRLWDAKALITSDAEPLTTLHAHAKPVLTAAFNPLGTMLITGSGDNSVRLWSVEERNNAGN
jgi:WD40 repeat protein